MESAKISYCQVRLMESSFKGVSGLHRICSPAPVRSINVFRNCHDKVEDLRFGVGVAGRTRKRENGTPTEQVVIIYWHTDSNNQWYNVFLFHHLRSANHKKMQTKLSSFHGDLLAAMLYAGWLDTWSNADLDTFWNHIEDVPKNSFDLWWFRSYMFCDYAQMTHRHILRYIYRWSQVRVEFHETFRKRLHPKQPNRSLVPPCPSTFVSEQIHGTWES